MTNSAFPADTSAAHIAVVVMAYNEAACVGGMLEELLAELRSLSARVEVVFVDDGSDDATPAIASEILGKQAAGLPWQITRHERNRGMGAALRSGVESTTARWITFLPADGQVAPSAVGILGEALGEALGETPRAGSATSLVQQPDLVTSVYRRRSDGPLRSLLSSGVRALLRLTHGSYVANEGPYLFRREDFLQLAPVIDTFALNFAFPQAMRRAHRTITTVEVECRPRRAGESKSARLSVAWRVAYDLISSGRFAACVLRTPAQREEQQG